MPGNGLADSRARARLGSGAAVFLIHTGRFDNTFFATVGRFSQRADARPQGWIPVCPVRDFSVWRQVQRRLWRGSPPTLRLSSGFWAFPDPYWTISGSFGVCSHFLIIRQADGFSQSRVFQNEQNGAKKRYKSQNSILRS